MFCYQCEEALNGTGCTKAGVCGKSAPVADSQDLLIYQAKGIAWLAIKAREKGIDTADIDLALAETLFVTITNANFDKAAIEARAVELEKLKKSLIEQLSISEADLPIMVKPIVGDIASFDYNSKVISILATENEDVRSLRELLIYGLKGMAAYAHHAHNLGHKNDDVYKFLEKGLAATIDDSLSGDELTGLVLECGKNGVDVMALLDAANTSTFGNPELTEVNIGVGDKPGILISGHDLADIKELLEQTEGTGVDVYTHSEMLPAHYYPELKKFSQLKGNYGNAWWKQKEEFASFNGPILFTTNCIVPPAKDMVGKIFTTGAAGFEGCTHIVADANGKKDFSAIIEMAKKSEAPTQIEEGSIVGGFAHNQVLALADKVVDAVKSGAVKQFFVMAGCDGRKKGRNYYTDFANELPSDTIILTAGCAKYRYNKLDLGDIGGIPRVLDAGQCNDSYSLAVIALKLKEVFELEDVNDLPISYNIAWYEQKAVIVLLALLSLGVKNIHLGPSLPAFLSPNVANVLVETFGISGITNVKSDMAKFLA